MNNPETLYDCLSVLTRLDEISEANDGEIPEDAIQALVVAQTTSMEKLGKLLGFMKYCEHEELICKAEIDRIQKRKKSFTNKLASVKKYLLPWVIERGKTTVGTITLSTRKSQAIELDDDFENEDYGYYDISLRCSRKQADEFVESVKDEDAQIDFYPIKKAIKDFLKENPSMSIKGAELITKQNLQIK